MKTYKITMDGQKDIIVKTNNACELLNALLEMSYKGEKRGMNIPLAYEDDAMEEYGYKEVIYSDCGDVEPIDTNGSAEELYIAFKKMNTYDLDCEEV